MLLTICTPTYNRAHTLPRLYGSLLNQGSKEFEWLVVDDGSTDDTQSLIQTYCQEGRIAVRYIRKGNGGKPSAVNTGVDHANGAFFICVDSDDWLAEGAFQIIKKRCEQIKDNPLLGGFAGLCCLKDGSLLEKPLKKEIVSNTIVMKDKFRAADKAEVFKTRLLKLFKSPLVPGESFIPEAFFADALTTQYPLLYINDILMGKEYLGGGLTDNILRIRVNNPISTCMYYEQRIRLTKNLKFKCKAVINFLRFSYHAGRPLRKGFLYTLLRPYAQKMYRSDLVRLGDLQ